MRFTTFQVYISMRSRAVKILVGEKRNGGSRESCLATLTCRVDISGSERLIRRKRRSGLIQLAFLFVLRASKKWGLAESSMALIIRRKTPSEMSYKEHGSINRGTWLCMDVAELFNRPRLFIELLWDTNDHLIYQV